MGIRASTETKLLNAADELFFTDGINATSIDAVLQRAGVSAATLYRGFASKEALVAAALDRRHSVWIDAWDSAIAEQDTARDKLLSVFTALDEFHRRPDASRWCAFLGSSAEYANPPEEIGRSVARDTDTLRTRLVLLCLATGSRRASALADELVLVVTGYLAMHLRDPNHQAATARAIATALVDIP